MSRSAHHGGAALAVLLGLAFAGVPAAGARRYAEAADPVAKVTQMNREALAAIDKREFEKAREILKRRWSCATARGWRSTASRPARTFTWAW